MALNLKKGARFDLQKSSPDLLLVGIGLGWDPNSQHGGPAFDLDASAFMIDSSKKLVNENFLVYYGNPLSSDNAVKSSGDDKTGGTSDGDDETLFVDLGKVDSKIQEIVITVTICKYPNDEAKDKRTIQLNFGQVRNCYIRLFNQNNNEEILRYNLNEKFTNEDAVEFGKLYRTNKGWEFEAIGKGKLGSLDVFISAFKNKDSVYKYDLAKGVNGTSKGFNLSKSAVNSVTTEAIMLSSTSDNVSNQSEGKNINPNAVKQIDNENHSVILDKNKYSIEKSKTQLYPKTNKAMIAFVIIGMVVVGAMVYMYLGGNTPSGSSRATQQALAAIPQEPIHDSSRSPAINNETPAAVRKDTLKNSNPKAGTSPVLNVSSGKSTVKSSEFKSNEPTKLIKINRSIETPKVACSFQAFSSKAVIQNYLVIQIKESLQKSANKNVIVEGYASSEGLLEVNQKLSQERADAVKSSLISSGIPEDRIKAIGNGIKNPLDSNSKLEGRIKNRRVEVVVK